MGDLGKAFHIRFGRTGDLTDIGEAISAHRRTVELFQAGDECLPVALSNLGASLVSRFKDVGDLRDAAEAIAVQHKAVGITPQSPRVLSFTLESLAISFLIRFAHTTEDSDVSGAIYAIRRAVQLTNPPIPHRVSVLGNALSLRFSSSGDRSDIDEAISMQQTAVSLTCNTDPNLPRHLTNLGSSFIQRYKSMTEPSDIDAAISALEEAVELTPEGHADLPVRLDHLGSAHSFRLLHSVDLVGRAKAIASLGSTDDTKQFASVNDGICVFYKAIGENLQASPGTKEYSGDNDKVIEILQKAVELTPEGHAMLPSRLAHLSWGLQRRFMTSGDRPTLTKVLSVLKRAATCTPGPPHDRLTAAITWAELLALEWPSPDTIPAFGTAMDLVALVAGLERSVELRHSQLREVSDLPLRAAVAACELGRLDKAIEWLEQGRCLVWRQLTNLRTPLDALRAHDAQLAEEVMGVSKRLEDTGASRRRPDAGMTQSERISLEAEARNQLQLARQWDDLLAKVRAIPEFEDFLKPTPYSTILRHLPDSGPIVVINVHEHQCDAFALLAGLDEPLHVPLPDLSLEKVVKYQIDLGSHLGKQGLRMRSEEEDDVDQDDPNRLIVRYRRRPAGSEDVTRNALKCLWVEIVKPVLDALGFSVCAFLLDLHPPDAEFKLYNRMQRIHHRSRSQGSGGVPLVPYLSYPSTQLGFTVRSTQNACLTTLSHRTPRPSLL
jgi:tetratricopeptide (TPR) repeat protein